MSGTVFYIGDPMCSWCWGFGPALAAVEAGLPAEVPMRYVMGGLAPDSDEPMAPEVRAYVQENWRAVEAGTGASFNWDFWERCLPRRSTYPACRAVLAAQLQDAGPAMFRAVQRAYYTEARNPSDLETLTSLAAELGLDAARFERDIASPEVEALLQRDFETRRRLGVREFPTLLIEPRQAPGRRSCSPAAGRSPAPSSPPSSGPWAPRLTEGPRRLMFPSRRQRQGASALRPSGGPVSALSRHPVRIDLVGTGRSASPTGGGSQGWRILREWRDEL